METDLEAAENVPQEEDPVAETKGASISSSVVNIATTTLGSSLLSVPYGFSQTGWLLGLILLTTVYLTTIYTNVMIADVAATTCTLESSLSYKSMAKQSLPNYPSFAYFVDAAVVVVGFAIGCSYTIVATDNLSAVTRTDRWIWPLVFTAISAPLCCLRNIDSLRFSSSFAVVCLLFLAAVVVAYAVSNASGTGGLLDPCNSSGNENDHCRGDVIASTNNITDVIKGMTFFIQGLVCHYTSPSIIHEMERPSRVRVAVAYAGGSGIAYGLFMVVGLSGYWTYGDILAGNILILYPNNFLTSTIRILMSFVVILGYPMANYGARVSLKSFVRKVHKEAVLRKRQEVEESPGQIEMPAERELPKWKSFLFHNTVLLDRTEVLITAIWLILTTLVALVVTDIAITLGIAGATGTVFIFYIAPGIMRYHSSMQSRTFFSRAVDIASVIFGVVVFGFGITFLLP